MTDELIKHRAARVSCRGVNDHARGLVNRDDMLVFVEYGQGEGLRFEGFFWGVLRKLDDDDIVWAQAQPRSSGLAIELHCPRLYELLQARARQCGLA
jgi:hypothetical protein